MADRLDAARARFGALRARFRALHERLGDMQVFRSDRARRRFLVHAAVALGVIVGFLSLVRPHLPLLTDAERLRSFIRQFGIAGPLVLIALQALQVVAAPVPGQVLAVAAGYLYGAWAGTLYNMVGITIGSTVAFWLSRRYGRSYVESIVHEDALARFDGIDDDHARLALLVVFLVPGLPDDVICFFGGLTRLPLWQLVALAVVGRAPAFFLVNVIGDLISAGRFEAATILALAITAVSAFAFHYRERLLGLFSD